MRTKICAPTFHLAASLAHISILTIADFMVHFAFKAPKIGNFTNASLRHEVHWSIKIDKLIAIIGRMLSYKKKKIFKFKWK
jgi:hypothetical protein